MQLTIKNWWLFTLSQTVARLLWKPKRPEKAVLQTPSNLYRTLSKLPMDRFLTCLCDEDLTALVIDGEAPETELKEAWVLLLSDYYELKGDSPESREQWQLNRDIIRLQNHLFLVQVCVDFLNQRYSEDMIKSLNKLGYPFRTTDTDPESYRPLLQGVINKSKSKYIVLQQLIQELQKKVAKISDKQEKPQREYFENLLIYIEEMQGTAYNMETTTVTKFISLEKKYFKMVEDLNRRADGK